MSTFEIRLTEGDLNRGTSILSKKAAAVVVASRSQLPIL